MEEKYVEVEGVKYIDDGTGSPKLDDAGNPALFVEEKAVPYTRFKEVNDKMKTLEGEIAALKTQKSDGGLNPEQKKELEAKTYLKNLLKETLDETKSAESEKKQAELAKFNQDVSEILSVNADVKKDDFLKFVEEEAATYGIKSVDSAMKLYRKINNLSKEVSEKTKKELLGRPKLPEHEGGGKQEPSDAGKSLWQIADEVIKGVK